MCWLFQMCTTQAVHRFLENLGLFIFSIGVLVVIALIGVARARARGGVDHRTINRIIEEARRRASGSGSG
jgi:hypothetical protein